LGLFQLSYRRRTSKILKKFISQSSNRPCRYFNIVLEIQPSAMLYKRGILLILIDFVK